MADEEYEGEGEQELVAEVKAFERTGYRSMVAELISQASRIDWEKKGREILTPEDRFIIAVDALGRRMREEGIADLTNTDIDNILERTKYVTGLRYKNPAGYILGYLATNGGKEMVKTQIDQVVQDVAPRLTEEYGVEAPDVIRYARFWRQFL